MKIRISLLDNIYKKISKRAVEKTLRALDYKNYYEAYKKYVIEADYGVPENIEFDAVDNPKVSIIIAVYNQYKLTMQCLNSIKLNAGIKDYEIILVDDCSTDETLNIKEQVKNITVIRNKENQGFLRNCNLAAKVAKGEYIYLLNNDTKVLPNAIKELVDTMEENSNIGAVGSKLVFPDGRIQEAGAKVVAKGRVRGIGAGYNPMEPIYNELKEVDYCCGASLMIRKNLWDNLNGFDELFCPGYYEETDLCMRITQAGYKVIYQPKSEIIHITKQTFSEKAQKLIATNRKKFYKKWKSFIH